MEMPVLHAVPWSCCTGDPPPAASTRLALGVRPAVPAKTPTPVPAVHARRGSTAFAAMQSCPGRRCTRALGSWVPLSMRPAARVAAGSAVAVWQFRCQLRRLCRRLLLVLLSAMSGTPFAAAAAADGGGGVGMRSVGQILSAADRADGEGVLAWHRPRALDAFLAAHPDALPRSAVVPRAFLAALPTRCTPTRGGAGRPRAASSSPTGASGGSAQ